MTQDCGTVGEVAPSHEVGDASPKSEAAANEAEQPSLPKLAVVALCLCNVAHFYSMCSLFSYAGIMSVDLGWAEDRDHAGFVAGFLSAANTWGRVPTAALWGLMAAKYGTRRGLMAAMASIALGTLLFGLCTDLHLAVAVRGILLGCGNGFVPLFPVASFELGGAERQTEVVGIVLAAATFIQLFGPAIGGWTYGLMPACPALLPNLLGTLLALIALVACCYWMPPQKPAVVQAGKALPAQQGSLGTLFCSSPMRFLVVLRLLHGLVNFAFFEVVPLWAISGFELGGLALSEGQLGMVLSCSAIGTALFMAKVAPMSVKRLGLRKSTSFAAAVAAAGLVIMPYLPGIHIIANSAINQIGATALALVNNAAPPEQRSVVNGIIATFDSIGKGAGPLFSAVAFAWTLVEWGKTGHAIVFVALGCILLQLLPGIAFLPASVETGAGAEKVLQEDEGDSPKQKPQALLPTPRKLGKKLGEQEGVKEQLVHSHALQAEHKEQFNHRTEEKNMSIKPEIEV